MYIKFENLNYICRKVSKAPISELETLTNLILKPSENKRQKIKPKNYKKEISNKSFFYKLLMKISNFAKP